VEQTAAQVPDQINNYRLQYPQSGDGNGQETPGLLFFSLMMSSERKVPVKEETQQHAGRS
jgi:hypothetical protein